MRADLSCVCPTCARGLPARCSIAAFEEGELGTPLAADKLAPHIAKRVAAAQRRAEPLKPAAAATPAAGRAAAQPAAAQAPEAARLALTPVAQPAPPAATPATVAAAQSVPTAGAAPAQRHPQAAAAEPASARKRIQPEPLAAAAPAAAAAGAAGATPAAGQQPAAKKPKRIVPEAVGPAPAVVGDSQQVSREQPCRGLRSPSCLKVSPLNDSAGACVPPPSLLPAACHC